ncbi:MAG: formate dehydrogenase accessory sulfurtransferase FdhD [Gammaproteobacteria bacterium]
MPPESQTEAALLKEMLALDRARVKRGHSVERVSIARWRDAKREDLSDEVAGEEPMEIRVRVPAAQGWRQHSIAVTMRTPGNDFELAAGFLHAEGAVHSADDIERIGYCTDAEEDQQYNIVTVYLAPQVDFDTERLSRHVFTTASCGICGKAALDWVQTTCPQKPQGEFVLDPEKLFSMRRALEQSQSLFARTGGLHASALFDLEGQLLSQREDVGRHNATDKLVGKLLLERRLPASNSVVLFSGRAAFELVHKSILAGIPFLAAVGAPSSLAVELARRYGVTLVGFLRDGRFNVYSGAERLRWPTRA